jgi:hypothetical protein
MKREIEYQVDLDNYLLSEKISGDFEICELVAYKYKLNKFVGSKGIENFIIDIRNMDLEFNENEFINLIESMSKKHSLISRKKHAIIIDYPKQFGWAEYLMLSLFSQNIEPKIRLFSDEYKAMNWLLE